MTTSSFMARLHNAWRAILNPMANAVEHELTEDRAERHADERIPTKRQYEESRHGSAGLEVRVKQTNSKREAMSKDLQAKKAGTDAADKALIDFATLPHVAEVRERAAKLREEHPLHAERRTFRAVTLPRWARSVIETVIVIADYGMLFGFLLVGLGLSFTMMASATDPTPVFNPGFFMAHPAEWVTAFALPVIPALLVLTMAKFGGRNWAVFAAVKKHPERAADLAVEMNAWERLKLTAPILGLTLGAVGYYLLAANYLSQFADELGWVLGLLWLIFPLAAFLVELYKHDPVAEVDTLILQSAAQVEAQKERLTAALMVAEDAQRAAWTSYDDLIRETIDGASGDLQLFDQLYMRADANSGRGNPLAPISDGAQPLVGRRITPPTVSTDSPARALPVVLEAQRGLTTEVAPWITKQIELDIQTLLDCRPLIDVGDARTARIITRFEAAYTQTLEKRKQRKLEGTAVDGDAASTRNAGGKTESVEDIARVSDDAFDRLLVDENSAAS